MIIKDDNRRKLKAVKRELAGGGVCILPAFTIFGLSASLFSQSANMKIFNIKKRSITNPFIVIADTQFIMSVSDFLDKNCLNAILHAHATVVVKTKIAFPDYVTKDNKTAFRAANTKLLRFLTSNFPITSTSINISGKKELNNIRFITNVYKNRVNSIVNGKVKNTPSTIVELSDKEIKILREGYNIDRIKKLI